MKKVLVLFALLAYARLGSAQEILANNVSALPPYFYCEIIAGLLPTHRDDGVLFDFGQKTGAWKYNYLTDTAGNKLLFSSGTQALNYMAGLGWEFLQAYASGDENDFRHYVLRIAPAQLTEAQREAMLTSPEREKPRQDKLK